MQFGPARLRDAEGLILSHSLSHATGVLKKGHVLTAADIAALEAAGIETVSVARLEPGDVSEDRAAARLAAALGGAHVDVAAAFTGRANLYAKASGLVAFQAGAIDAVNRIDESMTVATLAPYAAVEAGDMIATVKIIPFAVPEALVTAAVTAAARARLHVHPFAPMRAGLVLTRLGSTKESVLAKRERVTVARVEARGASIVSMRIVAHEAVAVAAAIRELTADGLSPILVFAASAIVDRADVIPAGLIAAGGVVERLGMPVDPGNLIMIGRLATTPVIGVPSCAGSPKLNGFDWVLARVLASLDPTPDDVARMGVGGLLTEIPTRPQPRDVRRTAGDSAMAARRRARVTAIVLAAGRSSRMAASTDAPFKLTAEIGGKPMVRHVVETALGSAAHDVIVVTGHNRELVETALNGLDVRLVRNQAYADGLATSLAAGIRAAGETDAALVLLGDMPRVTVHVLDRLIAAFSPDDGREVIVPTHAGRPGNPVLWGRRCFADILALAGDQGARRLLAKYTDVIREVDVGTPAIFLDIDTPDALAQVRAELEST